jgi:hypothetical protein
LFEVAEVAALRVGIAGAADRFGQAEELDAEALDVHRVGDHPFDRQLQHMGQVGLPAGDVGLALATVTASRSTATARILCRWAKA